MSAGSKYHSLQEYPVPPSYAVENSALAMLICNPAYIDMARSSLPTDSFADDSNAKLYKLLTDLNDKGESITVESIYAKVNSDHYVKDIIPKCYGMVTLGEASTLLSSLTDIVIKRKAYFAGLNMIMAATSGETGADEALEQAQNFITEAERQSKNNGSVLVRDAINNYADTLQNRENDRMSGKASRVRTSFHTLDNLTYGGFARGNLVIMAARPSIGKTAIMLQMARQAALDKVPTLIFSLEMTNDELVQRMALSAETLNPYDLASGKIDWTEFDKSTGKFSSLPLWFNDHTFVLDDIFAEIKQKNKRGECGVAFIDYLGLIGYRNNSSSIYQLVTDCTKRMKRLAKDCNIPIVLLCQLNRDMSKEGREPQLHDLRDSGSIEQDADIVLMLHRQPYDPEHSHELQMFVRKNRQGQVGDIKLVANNNITNFAELQESPF